VGVAEGSILSPALKSSTHLIQEDTPMIPRGQTCWYCYLWAGCTLCQRICFRVCFSEPRDPHAQFEEGKVAIETVDRFLTQ
jgi:hypothetical protein